MYMDPGYLLMFSAWGCTHCFLHGGVFADITGELGHEVNEDGQEFPGQGLQEGHGEHQDQVLKGAGHAQVLVVLEVNAERGRQDLIHQQT